MENSVYVEVFFLIKKNGAIWLFLDLYACPADLHTNECYLCYGRLSKLLCRHRELTGLFTCDACIYLNWHRVSDWVPYATYICTMHADSPPT